jgi:hypothetical protein
MEEEYDKSVHTEHCCRIHGCKYGDDDCPVENKTKVQSFECEMCSDSRFTVYILELSYDYESSSILSIHISREGAIMAAEKRLKEYKQVNEYATRRENGDSVIWEFTSHHLAIYPVKVEP